MSAGINELDKGIVQRDAKTGEGTWHGIPAYVVQDKPVTIEQARDVMCYPLKKEQLHRHKGFDEYETIDAWCIVREDHNKVLVPHVGSRFEVLDNSFLLNFINEHLLCEFEELQIESVGTLFNGATAFVNLKLDEFQIKGDQSPTMNRLMYYNPLGMGSYKACAHSIRIVCNNTLRASEYQGAANKTLAKFRHTANAGEKINDHLVDLAEIQMGLKKQVTVLEHLTTKRIVDSVLEEYLAHMFPLPVDDNGKIKEGRAYTIAQNKRTELLNVYNSDQQIDPPDSAYALLQATTNFLDHGNAKGGDNMSCRWDGIIGNRAKVKDEALNFLVKV
jgi:phage/plasmid-like protein (TIGR03299 family)